MDGSPIDIDPAIIAQTHQTTPLVDAMTGEYCGPEVVLSHNYDPDTVQELIDALESIRDEHGGDVNVKDSECGHSIHVVARKFDTGDVEVRL